MVKDCIPRAGRVGDNAMKKYKWLFAGIAALLFTTAIVLYVPARSTEIIVVYCEMKKPPAVESAQQAEVFGKH
jgi:hypothetical protein